MAAPFQLNAGTRRDLLGFLVTSDTKVLARAENLMTWYNTYTSARKALQGRRGAARKAGDLGLAGVLGNVAKRAKQLHDAVWDLLKSEAPDPNFFFPDLLSLLRPTPGSPRGQLSPLGWDEFAAALWNLAREADFYAGMAKCAEGEPKRGRPRASLRRLLAARLAVLFLDHYRGDPNSRNSNLEDFVHSCFDAAGIPSPYDRFESEWLRPVVESYERKSADIDILRM